MDLRKIRLRLDDERRYLARDGETIHVLPYLTRVVRDSCRVVSCSSLGGQDTDKLIAEELEHARNADAAFEWKLYSHDKPIDLLGRLQRQGLVAGEPEAVLVYDLADGLLPRVIDGCTVSRVASVDQLHDYRLVGSSRVPN